LIAKLRCGPRVPAGRAAVQLDDRFSSVNAGTCFTRDSDTDSCRDRLPCPPERPLSPRVLINVSHDAESRHLAAWRSGNVVGRINEVTLRRARLVLGWVINHLSISPSHLGQLSLLSSSVGLEMSTKQSVAMLGG